MSDEWVDLIILLPGNYLPIVMRKEQMATMDTFIQTTLADEDKQKRWLCFNDSDGWLRRVHPKGILGWYFRPHEVSQTAKAVALMEKMEKKMPDGSEGDDWKGRADDDNEA